MLKLPVDISTFSELIGSGYLYVDKTKHAHHMITGGRRFFLSRPRRFGKSLLVSTLKEILTGNKSLFNNLWIGHSDYEWKEHGIINLDFSKIHATDATIFKNRLWNLLEDVAQEYDIALDIQSDSPDLMVEQLIKNLHQRFGRVAILIDEYDSPILKSLHMASMAKEIRDQMQNFFSIIKSLDAQIQFVFITGVSSFAKAGLFSGINNLQILTLRDEYATICGYTDEEIDHYFSEYITRWTREENISYGDLRKKIKNWYNGYHFGDNVAAVYNPFSVMNALHIKKLENFWFQSGTPTFLVELLKQEHASIDLEKPHVSKDFLGIFDVGNIPPISLMFQAGYLTIKEYDREMNVYELDYPNEEVRISLQKYLLEIFAHVKAADAERISWQLKIALNNANIDEAIDLLRQLFAHVPYQLHVKEEKFYHALFMMICLSVGIKTQSEYSTSHGRIDMILDLPKLIYVIEIKFNKPAEYALSQIEERRYYEQFVSQKKPIVLLGLSFSRAPHQFDITYAFKNYAP